MPELVNIDTGDYVGDFHPGDPNFPPNWNGTPPLTFLGQRVMTRDAWTAMRVYAATETPSGPSGLLGAMKTSREFYMEGQQEVLWSVDGLIPRKAITLISGDPKVGKTTILMSILEAMQRSREWCGMNVPGQIVWYFTDEGAHTMAEAMDDVAPSLTWEYIQYPHMFLPRTDWQGDWNGLCEMIAMAVQQLVDEDEPGPTTIIIDTLISWAGIEEINSYSEVGGMLDPAKKLRDSTSCAVVLVHHNRKERTGGTTQKVLGSTALTGQVDHIVLISHASGDGANNANYRDIAINGRFRQSTDNMRVEYVEEDKGFRVPEDQDPRKEILELFNIAELTGHPEMSVNTVAENTPDWLGVKRVRALVKRLAQEGVLEDNGESPTSPKFAYRKKDV